MIELMRHKLEAYREREASQRSDALSYAAQGMPKMAAMYTRAADWTGLKISVLEREIAERESHAQHCTA